MASWNFQYPFPSCPLATWWFMQSTQPGQAHFRSKKCFLKILAKDLRPLSDSQFDFRSCEKKYKKSKHFLHHHPHVPRPLKGSRIWKKSYVKVRPIYQSPNVEHVHFRSATERPQIDSMVINCSHNQQKTIFTQPLVIPSHSWWHVCEGLWMCVSGYPFPWGWNETSS